MRSIELRSCVIVQVKINIRNNLQPLKRQNKLFQQHLNNDSIQLKFSLEMRKLNLLLSEWKSES